MWRWTYAFATPFKYENPLFVSSIQNVKKFQVFLNFAHYFTTVHLRTLKYSKISKMGGRCLSIQTLSRMESAPRRPDTIFISLPQLQQSTLYEPGGDWGNFKIGLNSPLDWGKITHLVTTMKHFKFSSPKSVIIFFYRDEVIIGNENITAMP